VNDAQKRYTMVRLCILSAWICYKKFCVLVNVRATSCYLVDYIYERTMARHGLVLNLEQHGVDMYQWHVSTSVVTFF
jgi:hypothetical protein